MPKKKNKPRKGFNRSQKEWEESIATHIGKIIDNLKGEDIINLAGAGISAYAGFRAGQVAGADLAGSMGVAGSAVIAYQLAKSNNVIAGGSGVAYLASLGLINIWNPLMSTIEEVYAGLTPRNIKDVPDYVDYTIVEGKATCPEGYHLERVTTEYPRLVWICAKD